MKRLKGARHKDEAGRNAWMKLATWQVKGGMLAVGMAALVCGVALAFGQEGTSRPAEAAAPLRLAVVDIDKVLSESGEWSDCQDERHRLEDQMRRTLDKHERQLRVLRSDYENAPPGTEAAAEKREQLEAALRQYDERKGEFEEKLRRQQVESLSKLFNEVGEIIRTYAEENGIDLVLRKQNLSVSPSQPVELGVVVTTAHVLYARPGYDITDAIVQELNSRYPGEIREK